MITGFNTDVEHNDKVYHVQTEDKGLLNPYVESLVYSGGEILASKKTSYAEQAVAGVDEKWISGLMEQQHRTMIAAVKRGRLDRPADEPGEMTQGIGAKKGESAPTAEVWTESEKSLDQVILDYLASEAEKDRLEINLVSHCEFVEGQQAELRIAARKSLSQSPISGAAVEVRLISTVESPRIIYKGSTAGDGTATIRCAIPEFPHGTAAVIISVQSDLGNDEFKQLVRRKK